MEYNLRKRRSALANHSEDDNYELRAKRAHLPPADFLSPKALLEILSFTPTHRAVARVCKEWRFISDNYVPHSEDEIMEKPPTEFLGAEGYELAVGKLPQKDAVRLVCEPGDNPLGVYGAIPDDLVAAVAKYFRTAPIKKALAMRGLKADILRDTHLNDVHQGICHTVFACAYCKSSMVEHDPGEEYREYFHVRHPSSAARRLTFELSFYADTVIEDTVPEHYDIKTVRIYVEEERCRFPRSPLPPRASRCLLSLNDLRLEVFRATSREDLDTCCLVSKKWKGEIDKSAHTLSLHQGYVHIVPRKDGTLLFCVNRCLSEKKVEQRTFHFPKLAATDSAIVHSHMRNWTSVWLEVNRMYRGWKCSKWIPAAMRSLVNSNLQTLRYAVYDPPQLTLDMLQLAETCQTRRFELQTVPVLFMRAVDSGLFLEALFHRLTSVQISIYPLVGQLLPRPEWLDQIFRLRGMHLVIVYDQWDNVEAPFDCTYMEGVVATIAKEFRERVEVADFVDKFDLQFVDSPVSLGTPSGKPVKEDLTLDDLPTSTKTPSDHWDKYYVQNASSPADVITVYVRKADPHFAGCRIIRGKIDI